MKRVKRILAAVTAAAMTLLIAPELGGEVFSQVGGLVRGFAVTVSAEEGEAAPFGFDPVQSETDTDSTVMDYVAADYGISAQSDVTVVDSGYCGDKSENGGKNVTWTLNNGVLTISGTGKMGNYEAPGVYLFHIPKKDINTAIIENGVTSVGRSAFNLCSNLTSVTIPNSVTSIDDYAFEGCTSLAHITIPDSVTSIGDSAFSDCTILTNITIPDSVTSIGTAAFAGCTSFTSITLPDSVTKIDDNTFRGCTSLASITIPNGVTKIGKSAFYHCEGLANITIPDSVTTIDDYAFEGCDNFISLTIPCHTIGSWVFNSDNLKSVIFSYNGSIYAKQSAFYACKNLTNISVNGLIRTDMTGHVFPSTLNHLHIPLDIPYYNYIYNDTAEKVGMPTKEEYYFPGGCGDPDCPLYVNGERPDKPIDPDNPDNPEDPNEPVDEETAKDYDFSVSVHLANSKDEIVYNVDEKTYNKSEYELGAYFDSSKGGKSINGLKVLYSISDGFAFSADGAKTEISSET